MQSVEVPISLIDADPLYAVEDDPQKIKEIKENITYYETYPSLIVLEKNKRYIVLDGMKRLWALKELGKWYAWCEVWKFEDYNVIQLAGLLKSAYSKVEMDQRLKLILATIYDSEDELKPLQEVLPKDQKGFDELLNKGQIERKIKQVGNNLQLYRLNDVVKYVTVKSGRKLKQNLARFKEAFNTQKLELTFVFKEEKDYYKAMHYFGENGDVKKLMKLLYDNS